jgi:hypothetical protein
MPLRLGWPTVELAFDAGEDLGELAVIERPDEDQAGVRSLGFGPLAREWRAACRSLIMAPHRSG